MSDKGNRLALSFSPHGAGRHHSRSAAKCLLIRADLGEPKDGIPWGHFEAFPDEHTSAHKDIDVVVEDVADLVSINHTLRQIVNVKGD